MNNNTCAFCGGKMPPERKNNAMYCSNSCKTKASNARKATQPQIADIMPATANPNGMSATLDMSMLAQRYANSVISRAGYGMGDKIGKMKVSTNDSADGVIHFSANVVGGAIGMAIMRYVAKKNDEKKGAMEYVMACGLGMTGGEFAYRGYQLVRGYINERRANAVYNEPPSISDKSFPQPVPGYELLAYRQPAFIYNGRYEEAIGRELSVPFQIAVYGAPGHGKSHVATELAAELSRRGRTLLVLTEEAVTSVVQNRLLRYGIDNSNLNISVLVLNDVVQLTHVLTNRPDIQFVVVDSLSALTPSHDGQLIFAKKLKTMANLFGSVLVVQVNKDESIRGSGELLHTVDTVLRIDNYYATPTMKNRFGGRASVPVFPENNATTGLLNEVINNTENRDGKRK